LKFGDYIKAMQEQLPMQDQSNTKLADLVRNWVSDNTKLLAFVIPPFMAFASRRIFFRKQALNFLEHSVPVFYLLGNWYWFSIIEAVIFRFTGFVVGSGIQLLVVSFYLGFAYTSFIETQPKWKTFLKGVGIYWTGYMLMMLAAIIAGMAFIFIALSLDPDILDVLRPAKQIAPK
jgi:hypothetical protein